MKGHKSLGPSRLSQEIRTQALGVEPKDLDMDLGLGPENSASNLGLGEKDLPTSLGFFCVMLISYGKMTVLEIVGY